MEINNVIICGLGALGQTYAHKLNNKCNLKILADIARIKKYKENPPIFNNIQLNLSYISPEDSLDADLIIISTKSSGLENAIKYIKNFVSEKTIIISLLNGISSENIISDAYPFSKTIRSFFIGGSAIREDNKVTQNGKGKLVIEKNSVLENFLNKMNIDYETSNNIIYSQWVKLGVNIILNQPSAIYGLTVGELRKKEGYNSLVNNLLDEISEIAQACGINNLCNYKKDVLNSEKLVSEDGKTSMYQDVLAKRKTEVEIFSGEILRLGKKFNINTPYNQKIYDKIKEIERSY